VCGMSVGYSLPEAVVNSYRTGLLAVGDFTTFLEN